MISKIYTFAVVLVMTLGCQESPNEKEPIISKDQFPSSPAEAPKTPEIPEGRLYVQKVMDACGAKMSLAKRNILSEQIRMVGESMFPLETERRWFYFLICIESRFNNDARSPVGATGLAQVMPKYAPEFAKACGLGELDPKDLQDSQVNLLVGACRFRELMIYYNGDPALALAAYNSGMDSPTVRKAASSDVRTGHPETVGYLAAAFVLQQRLKKEPGRDQTSTQTTAQLRELRGPFDAETLGISRL
jgi:hypothetical protein